MTRFDSNQAWKDATASVSANREVLLVLAGVFFLLPALAFALFFPQPEPAPGATPEQLMAAMSQFYTSAMPFVLVMSLIQAVGTLATLTLFTDRNRPTVGEAISIGVRGVLPYLGAQLLLGAGFGIIGGLLLAVAMATGAKAIAVVIGLMLVVALIYVALRTSLVAPVVAVDQIRNPIAALKRSWALTEGNAGKIMLFFFLLVLAFGIAMMVVMMIIGVVLALAAGSDLARTLSAVVSSFLTSVMTIYFIAALASIHRQLSGPSAGAISETFE